MTLLSGLAVTAVYTAIALRLSFWLTILVALAGAGLLWTFRGRTRRGGRSGADYSNVSRDLFHMASESIAGLKVAKSVGAETRDIAIFAGLARDRADGYLDLLRSFAQAKMRLDLSSAVVICVLLFVAVEGLGLRGAGLLVMLFVFARIMPRAMALQESAQMFVTGLPAFSSVMHLIDQCEAEAEDLGSSDSTRIGVNQDVRFESVSYRYTADGPLVLHEVSLEIPAGRTTAIVGPSGAGKSTLADLLIGLLRPAVGLNRDRRPAAGRAECGRLASIHRLRATRQLSAARHDSGEPGLGPARRVRGADVGRAEPSLGRRVRASAARRPRRGRRRQRVRLSGGERQRLALARALAHGAYRAGAR